jgi:hypothetical protein
MRAQVTLAMSRKTVVIALALLTLSLPIFAQQDDDPCPCIPGEFVWTVTTCDTWACAAEALAEANGDPNVFVVPSPSEEHRWLVMRRTRAGAVIVSPDEPFRIEQFSKMVEGSVRFDSIVKDRAPMLLTTYDRAILVLYLREAPSKRRSVGR